MEEGMQSYRIECRDRKEQKWGVLWKSRMNFSQNLTAAAGITTFVSFIVQIIAYDASIVVKCGFTLIFVYRT